MSQHHASWNGDFLYSGQLLLCFSQFIRVTEIVMAKPVVPALSGLEARSWVRGQPGIANLFSRASLLKKGSKYAKRTLVCSFLPQRDFCASVPQLPPEPWPQTSLIRQRLYLTTLPYLWAAYEHSFVKMFPLDWWCLPLSPCIFMTTHFCHLPEVSYLSGVSQSLSTKLQAMIRMCGKHEEFHEL